MIGCLVTAVCCPVCSGYSTQVFAYSKIIQTEPKRIRKIIWSFSVDYVKQGDNRRIILLKSDYQHNQQIIYDLGDRLCTVYLIIIRQESNTGCPTILFPLLFFEFIGFLGVQKFPTFFNSPFHVDFKNIQLFIIL